MKMEPFFWLSLPNQHCPLPQEAGLPLPHPQMKEILLLPSPPLPAPCSACAHVSHPCVLTAPTTRHCSPFFCHLGSLWQHSLPSSCFMCYPQHQKCSTGGFKISKKYIQNSKCSLKKQYITEKTVALIWLM